MLDRQPDESLLLPPRTRLLHIGPMKTGTTSVQAAANKRRDILLANGVRYPGAAKMHRRQLGALMGFSVDTWRRSGILQPDLMDVDTTGVPPAQLWTDLRAEIDADPERRVFITHEFVSQADDATARRVIDGVGSPLHICISLRAPGQIVPSLWAQGIKDDAQTEPYPQWLDRFYGKDPKHPISERYQRMYDQGQLVTRWADLVGPENVTVIVVDPTRPKLLTTALEEMLGLPDGTLDWKPVNRSLTAIESELFRNVNIRLRDRKATWSTFDNLVWKGALKLGPSRRTVPDDEPRVRLPQWAAALAVDDGRRFAEEIRQSGVRVIGELDQLAAEPRTADWEEIDQVPLELAAGSIAGAILAGQAWRQPLKDKNAASAAELAKLRRELAELKKRSLSEQVRAIPSNQRARQAAAAFGTRELAAALKFRLQERAQKTQSRLPKVPIRRPGRQPVRTPEPTPAPGHGLDPDSTPSPKATLHTISWTESGDLRLSGWVYRPNHDVDHGRSSLIIWIEDAAGKWAELEVSRGNNPEVDAIVQNTKHDYAQGWFDAVLPAAAWRSLIKPGATADHEFTVRLRYTDRGQRTLGGLKARLEDGSAGLLTSYGLGDGLFVKPAWNPKKGGLLLVAAYRSARARAVLDDHGLELAIAVRGGFQPTRLRLAPVAGRNDPRRNTGPEYELTADSDGHWIARLDHDQLRSAVAVDAVAFPLVVGADGTSRNLHWDGVQPGTQLPVAPGISLQARPAGVWRLEQRDLAADVQRIELDADRNVLKVRGQVSSAVALESAELRGEREVRSGTLQIDPDGSYRAEIALLADDRWGHRDLAPLGGSYRFRLLGPDGVEVEPEISPALAGQLLHELRSPVLRCQPSRDSEGELKLTFAGPLAAEERGKRARARLTAWGHKLDLELEDAVYFEAFGGKYASCNPRSIYDRMIEQGRPFRYYWGIRDFSVPVPEGAEPVLMHSREWYRVRARSRYLITNSWMQPTFSKRPGQQVVQTWHGTPYKMLALDRPTAESRPGFQKATRTESAKWDHLVVQSDYHAEVMASAYDYHGSMVRSGYPRNDVVNRPEGEQIRRRMRELLGIGEDQQAVLYAPTWREDQTRMVTDLDLVALRQSLGEDWVVLARGHGNVLRRDHDHSAPGVIDVTSYPQAEHLFLAADVAITDYSSIMFDYTTSGKPLLFFVPDLDRYAGALRGVYFDLAETAPGPLLYTTFEVVDSLKNLDQVNQDYADRYARWRHRFDPWDDGDSAARVIDAVFGPQ